ncbi:hypothetical protein [uncultured Sphaerochaeta sp.]|uniref:hypothetical protein n=1 Tax=uncultured Sphaerochaeta sp. TaxID=886478 RepID=UPI002A0A210E|nr:hypothetical protein [uncultured Sphaerochaeta sp.]
MRQKIGIILQKKKIFLLVVFLLALGLFSSCSSISNLVRSSVEGVPSWVYEPEAAANQTIFVGKGEGTVSFNARLVAYEDIITQLSAYIGQDVKNMYYRELTTTDAIAVLGLKITHEYAKNDANTFASYLMATADTAKLVSKRTDVMNAMYKRDNDIEAMLSKAEQAYRFNKDIEAINLYLEAAVVSSGGMVSVKQHEVDALLEKAEAAISALRFSISKSDASKATCTVYLRRKSRLLFPKILNAPIEARFSARNSLGRDYTDTLMFNTANNGFIFFVPYNQGIAGSGTIVFGLDLSEAISRLQGIIPDVKIQKLIAAVDANRVSFAYSLVSPLQDGGLLADIHEYSIKGELLTSRTATEAMCSELSIDSVFADSQMVEATEGTDLKAEIAKLNKQARYFLLGKVGIIDEQLLGGKYTVVVSGSVQIWDLSKSESIADTREIEAVAFDVDPSKARGEAFRRFGMIASSLLTQYLL